MISKKQKEVVDFIKKYMSEKGYSPSYAEIGEGLGISSKSTVFKHIKSLKERGFISALDGKKRSLYFTDNFNSGIYPDSAESPNNSIFNKDLYQSGVSQILDEELQYIPLYGYIQAGYPMEAVQIEETIGIPAGFAGKKNGELFALKVRGDSMEEDLISSGDTIILKKVNDVPNGRIVAAIVDGYEATLKRYYRLDGGNVKLMPSNPAFKPIILNIDRVKVIGELVGLIRKY